MSDDRFEDVIELRQAVDALRALSPGGLKGLPSELAAPLSRDDYARALAVANAAWGKGGPQDRAAALRYALLLQGRELLDEATNVIRKALAYHQQDVPLQLAQVQGLMLAEQDEAALGLLDGLRQVNPTDPRYWGFMGDLYLDVDYLDDAIACYQRALERGTKDADLAWRLGRILIDEGRIFDAAGAFERAARLELTEPALWMQAGDAWMEAEAYDRASECFGRVTRLEPEEEVGWLSWGAALHADGQLQAARKALERATKLDPMELNAWLLLGHVVREMGFAEEASHHFQRVLQVRPEDLEATLGLADTAIDLGDLTQALEHARRAVQIDPELADAHFLVGVVQRELHRLDEAEAAFSRAVALAEGEDPDMVVALATVRLLRGEALSEVEAMLDAQAEGWREVPARALEIGQALVRRQDPQALAWIDALTSQTPSPWWDALIALLAFVASAQQGADLVPVRARFDAAMARVSASDMPWRFDALEGPLRRLEREPRRQAEQMIRALEG